MWFSSGYMWVRLRESIWIMLNSITAAKASQHHLHFLHFTPGTFLKQANRTAYEKRCTMHTGGSSSDFQGATASRASGPPAPADLDRQGRKSAEHPLA